MLPAIPSCAIRNRALAESQRVAGRDRVEPRRSNPIENMFGGAAVAFEIAGSAQPPALLESEIQFVERAVPNRRREFAAGRACARAGLELLGLETHALPIGPDRRPIWPLGVIGSISHTSGLCCAAVALRSDVRSLGLDVQAIQEVSEDTWPSICTPAEWDRISALAPHHRQTFAALIFSAKEAFFKAQFEVTGAWVDFTELSVSASGGRIRLTPSSASIRKLKATHFLEGRYMVGHDIVITTFQIGTSNI